MLRRLTWYVIGWIGVGVSMPVTGGEYDTRVFRGEAPTEAQLIDALKPEERINFRGITPSTPASAPRAVSLDMIQFEFNSYELTPASKQVLDVLGKALGSAELKEQPILIEGHTDSSGGDDYNQVLSEKRAQAVKDYLVSAHSISPERLRSIGKGERDLLNRSQPTSSENRRVQFVNESK